MESKYNDVMNSKTPVSWIEEISRKQGTSPNWNIFDVGGEIKSPVPRYKCVLKLTYKETPLTAEAIQRSKKEAKHSAAKSMLDNEMKLTPKDYFEINGGVVRTPNPVLEQAISSMESDGAGQVQDSEIGINPIGELLDLCDKLDMGVPEYNEKDRVGPPHMPIFECICTVNGEPISEKAKTKKQAKRRVAHRWLMTLRGRKVVENVEGVNSGRVSTNCMTNGNGDGSSGLQLPQPAFKLPCSGSFEDCASVVAHKNHIYQKMSGEIVNMLKNNECDEEAINSRGGVQPFLQMLGQECKLSIDYKDFDDTENAQGSMLSILSIRATDRPEVDLVLFGSGDTKDAARNVAAKEAIEHIEVFSK